VSNTEEEKEATAKKKKTNPHESLRGRGLHRLCYCVQNAVKIHGTIICRSLVFNPQKILASSMTKIECQKGNSAVIMDYRSLQYNRKSQRCEIKLETIIPSKEL
jgi:hypothetical protein